MLSTALVLKFIMIAVLALTSCGGRYLYNSKSSDTDNTPAPQSTAVPPLPVIPPVPVIGSYLHSIFLDENTRPITDVEILADSGRQNLQANEKGVFSLPLGLVTNDLIDIDVKSNGKTLFLRLQLPADIANEVRKIAPDTGVIVPRLLGIRLVLADTQDGSSPETRLSATTWSFPAQVIENIEPTSSLAKLRLTSHSGGEITEPSIALKGDCDDGHKILVSGDVSSTVEGLCTTLPNSVAPSFDLTVNLRDPEGIKVVVITQIDPNSGVYVAQQLMLNFKPPFLAPTLVPANVKGLRATLSGTCDSTVTEHSATTTLGSIRAVNCLDGKLSVIADLPAGIISLAPSEGTSFSVTVNSVKNGFSRSSAPVVHTRAGFDCPTGYIGVPRSGIPGLGNAGAKNGHANWWLDTSKDFCVMKYPAKNNNGSTFATSTVMGAPWVFIERGIDESTTGSALSACKDAGAGYRLISNTQWQTVTRNAESVASNWSGNAVGSGVLARGHSDGTPPRALEHSSDDDPYFLTENTGGNWNTLGAEPPAGTEQRRTQLLSNGEIIWDLSGNVYQWVSDNREELGISSDDDLAGLGTNGWRTYLNNMTNRFSPIANLIFGSSGMSGVQFSELQNAGQIFGGTGGTVLRSGFWDLKLAGGLFAAVLNNPTTANSSLVGFRCVYLPQL